MTISQSDLTSREPRCLLIKTELILTAWSQSLEPPWRFLGIVSHWHALLCSNVLSFPFHPLPLSWDLYFIYPLPSSLLFPLFPPFSLPPLSHFKVHFCLSYSRFLHQDSHFLLDCSKLSFLELSLALSLCLTLSLPHSRLLECPASTLSSFLLCHNSHENSHPKGLFAITEVKFPPDRLVTKTHGVTKGRKVSSWASESSLDLATVLRSRVK